MSDGGGFLLLFLAAAAAGNRKDEVRARTKAEARDRDVRDAQFGRGSLVGKTGNPFIDDPFFNPWAPGGSFSLKGNTPKARGGVYLHKRLDMSEEEIDVKAKISRALSSSIIFTQLLQIYRSVDISKHVAEEQYKQKWGYPNGFSEYDERDFRKQAFEDGAQSIQPPILKALLQHFSQGSESGPLLIPDYGFDWSYGSRRDNWEFVSVPLDLTEIAKNESFKSFAHVIEQAVRQQVEFDSTSLTHNRYNSYRDDFRDRRPADASNLLGAHRRGGYFLVELSHHVLGTGRNVDITILNDYFQNKDRIHQDISTAEEVASRQTEAAIRSQWMLRP